MNPPEDFSSEASGAIALTAGEWVARRDRGLTAAEQDAFFQWLRADPRHRIEIARLDRTWGALDSLAAWHPADSAAPNPDLLAPSAARRAPRRAWLISLAGLGLAAAIAWLAPRSPAPAPETPAGAPGMRVIPRPERQTLADGSIAEPNHGARLEFAFAATERRVRLRAGEVHLSVEKDPARPFVVEAGGVIVRAVGTAFNVRLDRDGVGVDVLVTEGSVLVESPAAAPVPVASGERARIGAGSRPVVTPQNPEIIARDLAWRGERLEFEGLPLRAVVAEFNLRNARQLAIGDAAAGRVKVAGTFRADEPEAFARLLEAGFGIAVERHDAGAWMLHSAPAKK
jgi:transmembrane sensor